MKSVHTTIFIFEFLPLSQQQATTHEEQQWQSTRRPFSSLPAVQIRVLLPHLNPFHSQRTCASCSRIHLKRHIPSWHLFSVSDSNLRNYFNLWELIPVRRSRSCCWECWLGCRWTWSVNPILPSNSSSSPIRCEALLGAPSPDLRSYTSVWRSNWIIGYSYIRNEKSSPIAGILSWFSSVYRMSTLSSMVSDRLPLHLPLRWHTTSISQNSFLTGGP